MSIFSYIRKHAVITVVIVVVVIIIAIIAGRAASTKAPVENAGTIKQVTLVNAATFRKGNISVFADGIVESHSQADLKSQTSAPVAVINVSIGETVYTGQTILELQNSDIRAQLAQAQAGLALARGQYSTGAVSLNSAKQAIIDKIRDAYNKTYDAVVSQAEPILYNNDGNGGRLTSYTTETTLYSEITSADIDLKSGLREWKTAIDVLTVGTSSDKINAALLLAKKNMITANVLLNDMLKIINDISVYATPTFIAPTNAWKSAMSAASASVSGASQSLTAAEQTLNTASSSQGGGGTAEAQVSAAQAGVNNLEAQLAKTIIRSPISGKVAALPLREGELASPGTLLATVIGNDSGLEIKAYVSAEDLSRVKVGASVIVEGNASSTITGVVSNVSPGVDALTRKAEVDIDVTGSGRSALVIGQNVTVAIAPLTIVGGTNNVSATLATTPIGPVTYLLPIQDIKIIPGSAYVFTIGDGSKIVRNDVTLGEVRGDFIEVTGGLSDDMQIVTPVYELDEGQVVKVQ